MLQILFILLLDIRFPVPTFWIQEMNNATVQEGLIIEVEEATFTLGGKIGIRNARLKATGKDLPPLCFIRRLDAHFKLGSLLMGNFVPTDASIEDAWCLSADQERNPALENCSGTLHFREEIIRFAFEGRALSSRLDFRGFWNSEKAFPRRIPVKKTSRLLRQDFSEMYWQAIKWSDRARRRRRRDRMCIAFELHRVCYCECAKRRFFFFQLQATVYCALIMPLRGCHTFDRTLCTL